ncbi:hypothetical protein OXYTRIMIC_718 [Oxytricha trifallax]|uniref:Uncharacterized protein n=1 Tax=Oxytricha trifallax TaxID=1172189 RepID=A0A073I0R9_9SPIT|nr:hypothetical protein OXYTRIMIC_718 [Oxytricha trifallax]
MIGNSDYFQCSICKQQTQKIKYYIPDEINHYQITFEDQQQDPQNSISGGDKSNLIKNVVGEIKLVDILFGQALQINDKKKKVYSGLDLNVIQREITQACEVCYKKEILKISFVKNKIDQNRKFNKQIIESVQYQFVQKLKIEDKLIGKEKIHNDVIKVFADQEMNEYLKQIDEQIIVESQK